MAEQRTYTQAELNEACQIAVERTLQNVRQGRIELTEIRPGQQDWHATWRGAPVWTLRSVEDAQALVQTLRGTHG